jgi:hypothetical protein
MVGLHSTPLLPPFNVLRNFSVNLLYCEVLLNSLGLILLPS